MAGDPTTLNGVVNNSTIIIQQTIPTYSTQALALAKTGASGQVTAQTAYSYRSGGFVVDEASWPAVTIRFNLPGNSGYYEYAWINTEQNLPLYSPTQPSLAAFEVADSATNVPLTLTANQSGNTHDVTFSIGGANIATRTALGDVSSVQLSQAESRAILAKLPAAVSGTLRATVVTKRGSEVIGTRTVDAGVTVSNTVMPSIASLTATETVANIASTVGAFLQALSRIRFNIVSAAAGYGASISGYEITFNGITYKSASGTTGTVNRSGTLTATGKVTDSRGRTDSKTLQVTLLAHRAPRITSAEAFRCTSGGAAAENGTYVRVNRSGSISSLVVNGAEKNQLTIKVEYKRSTASSWTLGFEQSYAQTTYGGNNVVGGGAITVDASWDIRLTISDRFSTTVATFSIPTERVPLDIHADVGIGVGKRHERGALDVDLTQTSHLAWGIEDVRNTNRAPSEYTDKAISTEFANTYGFAWASGLTFRGWNADYQTWQLISGAASTLDGRLMYRHGKSATWQAWQRILTDAMYGHGGGINADSVDGAHLNALTRGWTTSDGHWQIANGAGSGGGWMKTTDLGILPIQSGAGYGGVGAIGWAFLNGFIQRLRISRLYNMGTGAGEGDQVMVFSERGIGGAFDIIWGNESLVSAIRILTWADGLLRPYYDNRTYLGGGSYRWKAVSAVNGPSRPPGAHKTNIHAGRGGAAGAA